ncbi:MAG: two pore domain potassium channel family protein [Burkholderiales bacterium]|uniref:potassium channel family protein n=1 Tax=Nitrosomonas sp. TaxID=42353 RepID=UPI001D6E933E|nr:potassium channel family protein [Nitrosomonas sp.]MCB1948266.1 two pore domain potassium channel family protein [Nitrosomonas sp.]MCP5243392.1 two pore domain potassium channel family protein [Burkholderiales bacterium]
MNEYTDHFTSHLGALLISGIIVICCVVMHYEALRLLGHAVGAHFHKRIGMLIVMLGLLAAHVIEIILFALGYMVMQLLLGLGHITNLDNGSFLDYIYYSSVVYTTVGFGDLLPVGAVRMLSAAEGLVGLAMITWSASFTFLAMKHFWPHPLNESSNRSSD